MRPTLPPFSEHEASRPPLLSWTAPLQLDVSDLQASLHWSTKATWNKNNKELFFIHHI